MQIVPSQDVIGAEIRGVDLAAPISDEVFQRIETAFNTHSVLCFPQQVLKEVETVGATRTRAGVVSRALNLPLGQPVNLEEWALARKRLFDTNVFRSVDIQAVPLGDPVNGIQPVKARRLLRSLKMINSRRAAISLVCQSRASSAVQEVQPASLSRAV